MSDGPTYTGGSECYGGWINVQISKKDWCSFKGRCDVDKVVNRRDLCLYCVYRKPLHIPDLINERKKK